MEARARKTRDMAYVAVFAALLAVCAWIAIPTDPPFTLQTMGVCLAAGLLGGKRGSLAVLIYILLGAFGLPVFSGFTGGFGILLGTTGGYIIGFLMEALTMWLAERLLGRSLPARLGGMVLGLLVCYAFGTAWFMAVYARSAGAIGLGAVLGMCVFPFVLPDLVKIAASLLIIRRVEKYVR